MKRFAGRATPDRPDDSCAESSAARFSAQWLDARLRMLAGPLRGQRFCLALSGGLDSSLLLQALASLHARRGFRLRALHVDHGLHPDSGLWAARAVQFARACGVACEVLRVRIQRPRGASLEAEARSRRYQALRARLLSGEYLVTAHHQDDQLETVLLALMRGSGLRGLRAMPGRQQLDGAPLLRPLLPISRAELERCARARGMEWVEDPSNADLRFDRNFLRQRILPELRGRWPAAAASAARSARWIGEAQAMLEEQAAADISRAVDAPALRVSSLRVLPAPRRRQALRAWLLASGLSLPDHRRLEQIAGPLLAARDDASPMVRWNGGAVRRFDDRLFANAPPMLCEPDPAQLLAGSWNWRRAASRALGEGATLRLLQHPHGDIDLERLPHPLEIAFRRGGERLRASHGSLALKDLLQTQGIAPWDRARVPLLRVRGRIVAVADLWLDAAYRADPRSRAPRARLVWQRPPGAVT